jgi:hypothetical protein
VLIWEASAVAQAAMETGVAQAPVDLNEYRDALEKRLGRAHEVMRAMIHKAQAPPSASSSRRARSPRSCALRRSSSTNASPSRFCWETKPRIRAAKAEDLHACIWTALQIVDPLKSARLPDYADEFYQPAPAQRRITRPEAEHLILEPVNVFGAMMVRLGDADALVGGLTDALPGHHPARALQIIPGAARHAPGFRRLRDDHAKARHLLPGGRHGQHRTDRRGSGRDRGEYRGDGAALRRSLAWPCSPSPISAARVILWPKRSGRPWSWCVCANRV